MKKKMTVVLALVAGLSASAQETINMPVVQTKYVADPAPYVHGDTGVSVYHPR